MSVCVFVSSVTSQKDELACLRCPLLSWRKPELQKVKQAFEGHCIFETNAAMLYLICNRPTTGEEWGSICVRMERRLLHSINRRSLRVKSAPGGFRFIYIYCYVGQTLTYRLWDTDWHINSKNGIRAILHKSKFQMFLIVRVSSNIPLRVDGWVWQPSETLKETCLKSKCFQLYFIERDKCNFIQHSEHVLVIKWLTFRESLCDCVDTVYQLLKYCYHVQL